MQVLLVEQQLEITQLAVINIKTCKLRENKFVIKAKEL